ncbi:MAG: hypothetical protein ABIY62_07360 [Ginsengibacter sp.]
MPLAEALRMAATYPAKLIHAHNIGKIETVIKQFIIFNSDLEVKQIETNGNFN